jgi:hypothetical protein
MHTGISLALNEVQTLFPGAIEALAAHVTNSGTFSEVDLAILTDRFLFYTCNNVLHAAPIKFRLPAAGIFKGASVTDWRYEGNDWIFDRRLADAIDIFR